jgi:hypothetical protein
VSDPVATAPGSDTILRFVIPSKIDCAGGAAEPKMPLGNPDLPPAGFRFPASAGEISRGAARKSLEISPKILQVFSLRL